MQTIKLKRYFDVEDGMEIYNWLTNYTKAAVTLSRLSEIHIPTLRRDPKQFYYMNLAGKQGYSTCATFGLSFDFINDDEAAFFKLTWC